MLVNVADVLVDVMDDDVVDVDDVVIDDVVVKLVVVLVSEVLDVVCDVVDSVWVEVPKTLKTHGPWDVIVSSHRVAFSMMVLQIEMLAFILS